MHVADERDVRAAPRPELRELPVGLYSAVITGTGRLAALARHAWPSAEDFEDQDLAIATASEPARDLIVPFAEVPFVEDHIDPGTTKFS